MKKNHFIQRKFMVVIDEWQIQDLPEDGAPTPEEGALTYYFAIFLQKLHSAVSLRRYLVT